MHMTLTVFSQRGSSVNYYLNGKEEAVVFKENALCSKMLEKQWFHLFSIYLYFTYADNKEHSP